jgi:Putative antitoxin of bacterial toxin-antitoxin system, YdaS/YdaT
MTRSRITKGFTPSTPDNADPTAIFTIVRRPTWLALELAIEKAGSEAQLAKRLGVSQQAVHSWKQPGREVPMTRWEMLISMAEHGDLI